MSLIPYYKDFFNEPNTKSITAKIPEKDFDDLILDNNINLPEVNQVDGNVSDYEIRVIAKLVKHYSPSVIFEIGTFNGRTTLTMAKNTNSNCKIFTLDLPPDSNAKLNLDENDVKYIRKPAIGEYFFGSANDLNITQLYGDSATFDYGEYNNKIDFVFIDGSHSYEYVIKDTQTALKLLKNKNGIILWHDYDTQYWPGVTKALNEFYENDLKYKLFKITNTSIVILK